jgi:geranylgeranyl diphosphate/geranylgeranyl-bacteriochlorophyllide a reductase
MDVAIVGGGPAGALAAARLAAAGRDVGVFHDGARDEKPCGGGIPWRGVAQRPFLLDPALPRKVVARLLLIAPSGQTAEVALSEPVHVFSRATLDGFLRRRAVAAGARLIPRRVVHMERAAAGERAAAPGRLRRRFVLTDAEGERHAAGVVVGADGVNSVVRRACLGARKRESLSQTVGWYIPGRTDNRMVVRFEAGIEGYHWSFPRVDHLAIGVCARLGSRTASELWDRCERFALSGDAGTLPDRAAWIPYSALIPAPVTDGHGRVVVEGDGWALLGDAAGAVDPLTREGIHYALETADLWADTFLESRPGGYAASFHERFPSELTWAARHAASFFHPAFTERVVRYAARSASIRAVVSDLVAGRQPYRTLRRRLMACVLPLAAATVLHRVASLRRPGSSGQVPA